MASKTALNIEFSIRDNSLLMNLITAMTRCVYYSSTGMYIVWVIADTSEPKKLTIYCAPHIVGSDIGLDMNKLTHSIARPIIYSDGQVIRKFQIQSNYDSIDYGELDTTGTDRLAIRREISDIIDISPNDLSAFFIGRGTIFYNLATNALAFRTSSV